MVRAVGTGLGSLGTARRTPEASLREIFLRASATLPGGEEDRRGEVVAEALGHLQQGFGSHYQGARASDDAILVGDVSYAWAVDTIARLDEPSFVEVASRMIRDGAGEISRGGAVTLELWIPHLAQLLGIISGEDDARSMERIRSAVEEVAHETE